MTETFIFDIRKPKTQEEKPLDGHTKNLRGSRIKIFINKDRVQTQEQLINTLIHEFVHALVTMYEVDIGCKTESYIAWAAGNIVEKLFTSFKDAERYPCYK